MFFIGEGLKDESKLVKYENTHHKEIAFIRFIISLSSLF